MAQAHAGLESLRPIESTDEEISDGSDDDAADFLADCLDESLEIVAAAAPSRP